MVYSGAVTRINQTQITKDLLKPWMRTDKVPKHEGVQRLESDVLLNFYLEQTDELIESNNYEEMSIVEP